MSLPRWTIVSILLIFNASWVACTECIDGEYGPDPYDCNGFLQCEFGRWVQRNCPTGLHFNRIIMICDFPWNANCELGESTTTSPTTTTTDFPTGETETLPTTTTPAPTTSTSPPTGSPPTDPPLTPPPITTTTTTPPTTTTTPNPPFTTTTTNPPFTTTTTFPTGTTSTTSPTTTTTLLPTFPPILECTPNDGPYVLHLPHPDCTMFYKCVHGVPHEMLCPSSQHWAMALDRCDSPFEANCVDGAAREQLDARPPNYW